MQYSLFFCLSKNNKQNIFKRLNDNKDLNILFHIGASMCDGNQNRHILERILNILNDNMEDIQPQEYKNEILSRKNNENLTIVDILSKNRCKKRLQVLLNQRYDIPINTAAHAIKLVDESLYNPVVELLQDCIEKQKSLLIMKIIIVHQKNLR